MSTNSRLRMVLPSGEAKKPIYCHWDGYPSHMLPTLRENYNTIEKVRELLDLGNLSSLGERVKPDPGEEHSFDKPNRNITVAYHRDRGEDLDFWEDRQSYNYIFNGESWEIE